MEDFFLWVDSLDFEAFESILSERLQEESKKIGELIFQDRFADLVDEKVLIKAFIKIFWDRLEQEDPSLKTQPA